MEQGGVMEQISGIYPSVRNLYPTWYGAFTNLKNKKSIYVDDIANNIYAPGLLEGEPHKITYQRRL